MMPISHHYDDDTTYPLQDEDEEKQILSKHPLNICSVKLHTFLD